MIKIKNTLINSNVLEKYFTLYKKEIKRNIDDKLEIIAEWKKKLQLKDKNKNFYHEKRMYPYFQEKFLKGLLNYDFSVDWVFEDSNFTLTGVVEFTIKNQNDEPILLIELKGQKSNLDKPQHSYGNKTPVQQAYNYALNSDADWYVVCNYDELRIYNKYESYLKENYISFNFSELNENELIFLVLLLSKEFLKDKNILNDLKKETLIIENEITDRIYKLYHETRLIIIRQLQDNNKYEYLEAIKYAQLILNRIMFISFAEDRNFLPNQILEETINRPIVNKVVKFKRYSVWQELNNLFEDINEGHKTRNIAEYNGGLFDENLNFIKIPDLIERLDIFKDLRQNHKVDNSSVKKIVRAYQNTTDGYINPVFFNFLLIASFNFNTDINVELLGHIFEQSITDLEELQKDVDLISKEKKSHEKRKKEGIFYTPEYVTDFICRNTIIPYLSKNNANTPESLVDEFGDEDLEILDKKLKEIKILDMACGSGAFLNKAANVLLEIHKLIFLRKQDINYKVSNNNQGSLKQYILDKYFDSVENRKRIILNNIYGVDINSESVGITKLSLFLEIASLKEKLPDLSSNIKNGNSLIDNEDGQINPDLANELVAFNWNNEFKEIIEKGGFDVIIGNPPYVRQEDISDFKIFFEKKYDVYDGIADLYCYFYEKGINLLKKDGRLGYISSNKWMKTKYGKNLRVKLQSLFLEKIVNFFELNVFKEASTEPIIVILKNIENLNEKIEITLVKNLDFNNLSQYVEKNHFYYKQNDLDDGGWNLYKGTQVKTIIEKIKENSVSLKEYIGNGIVKRGLMTGKNDVYVISKEKYEELVNKDPNSKEIIKPLQNGIDIQKFVYEPSEMYILLIKIGTALNTYPAIKEYLLEHKEVLEDRHSGSKGDKWFELRKCAYYDEFEKDKIIYIHTSKEHPFALDSNKKYLINNCYFISSSDKYLLSYLNSVLFRFYKINTFVAFGDARTVGRCKLDHNKMWVVPIRNIEDKLRKKIDGEVSKIINLKTNFFREKDKFLSFIQSDYEINKLSNKIKEFWLLDSTNFLKELQKLKKGLTAKSRKEIFELYEEVCEKLEPFSIKINEIQDLLDEIIFNIYNINSQEQDFIKNFVS